jgi:hypothetical protein
MKKKKDFKYYALIFVFSSIAFLVYMLFLRIRNGAFDIELIKSLIYVPFMFTALLFLFDLVFDKIFTKKGVKGNVKFDSYMRRVSNVIQKECDFSIEDYTRLRNDQRFQKGLGQAFRVYDNGETKDLNFDFLERKFKKGTNEYVAYQVVIKEVKKMMEKS